MGRKPQDAESRGVEAGLDFSDSFGMPGMESSARRRWFGLRIHGGALAVIGTVQVRSG